MSPKRSMILESPLKIRDEIQQLNRATMPIRNGNGDSIAALENIDAIRPIQPIQRKTFPARVNELEMLSSFVKGDASKRFSNSESSFIFLILC